jgi:hypothetical protein
MLTITCESQAAAQDVREVFRGHGVNTNLVRDIAPQADSNIYLLITYLLQLSSDVLSWFGSLAPHTDAV